MGSSKSTSKSLSPEQDVVGAKARSDDCLYIFVLAPFLTAQFSPAFHYDPMRQSTPDKWISQLLVCRHLPEADMKVLCDTVRTILMEESNIQPVSSPVTICGDIHGQFWDLLELLRKGGMVPETSYIFMVSTVCPLSETLVGADSWLWVSPSSFSLSRARVILWIEDITV